MGVYIKGMKMPRACVYRENGHLITCPLYDIDGYCGALNTEASHKENGKLSGCPLVPAPPHGRLIDADALDIVGYCGIPQGREDTFDDGVMWLAEQIDAIPTIIPAEEGE